MEKIQDFVVRGKDIFIGLEDSKRSWKVCVRSEGMIVHETSMPADYEVLRKYLQQKYPTCRASLMYEAGFGGFWLHDLLKTDGVDCIVTPAHTVTEEKVNTVKTDRVDARRLAKNLENGDYKRCEVPDKKRREDRQISRTLNQMQREITSTKNRIRKFLDYHGLNQGFPAGTWRKPDYQRAKGLTLSHSLQVSLDAYFRILEALEKVKKDLLLELKALCAQERYGQSVKIKQSFPGVGWLSAIRFTLEWGKMTRFNSGKQLASFVGLTSREYSTGERVHRGRITGQGSGIVRAWLIQCAWRALSLDPVLLAKFQVVWRNSGSKKKAIVAVARKLVVRMRALEIIQQPYYPGVVE
jgi:transposase